MNGEKEQETFFDAIYHGDCDTVREMLAQGFSANTRNRERETALVYAASHGRDNCVQALLDYGAAFQKLPIIDAAVPRDASVLRRFVQMNGTTDAETLQDALLEAAFYGNADSVALLLANGANPQKESSAGQNIFEAPELWDCTSEERAQVLSLLRATFRKG